MTHVEGRRAIVLLLALLMALTMVVTTAPAAEAAPDPIVDVQWTINGCDVQADVTLSQGGPPLGRLYIEVPGVRVIDSEIRPDRGAIVTLSGLGNTFAPVRLVAQGYDGRPISANYVTVQTVSTEPLGICLLPT